MADGSLKFDTKIDTGEFDKSIASLSKAVERFSAAVDKLSGNIANSFQGAGTAVQKTGEKAAEASKGVESIGAAANEAKDHVKDLQKQMENIKVEQNPGGEPLSDAEAAKSKVVPIENTDVYGYDKSAMEFVEQYGQQAAQSGKKVNEFRQEIEGLKGQMKQLESQGMYFGDEEYDKAYLKLQKVEQALKDYKKELASPTPDANPFGTDSMSGKILDLQTRMQKLAESGKGLGDAEYDELYRKLAIAKEEAKNYAAELAKTPAMIEKENQLLAEKQAKQEAAAQKEAQRQAAAKAKEDAKIAAEEKALQVKRAAEVQEALEQQRLEGIAQAAQVSASKVVKLREELAQLNARQADLGKAGLGLGYQEYDTNAQKIVAITAKLNEYKTHLNQSGKAGSKFAAITKAGFGMAEKAVMKFGKSAGNALAKKAGQAVGNLKNLGKASGSVSKSVLKLSNMFKLMLIRMAMREAIQAAKEGFENLVQYSAGANKSMSELSSGTTYLKNSFAAAFAPILSIVVPPLTTIINLLATAVSWVNQFFAALGGATSFVRAKKVNEDYAKSLKKTGGAASSAGKEAKKALAPFDDLVQIQRETESSGGGGGAFGADPSQMFETAVIDKGISDFANELKSLWDAGDWEGIGKLLGEKINEQVEKWTDYISWDNVGDEITAFVLAFTTLFNSLVATINWYNIGVLMGTGINTLAHTLYLLLTQIDWQMLGAALAFGLNGMVHTVDWDLFGRVLGAYMQAKIAGLYGFVTTADWASIGKAMGTGLNGIIAEIDWAMLGLDFALGLSGLFSVADNFATTYDWSGFGSSLALSMSMFFQNFDWAGAGTAISDIVIGILTALLLFLTETDWWAFGEGVATSIESIDWSTVASRFFAVIGAAFGGFAAFLGGLLSDGVTAAKEYFQGKIEECGGDVVAGILKGIIDGMLGIGNWIVTNIFKPFIDGFKAAFGIHSPSTVMAEMGQYLWEGFCNGIKEFFSDPTSFIQANITDPFINGVKNLLGIHSPSTVLQEIGGYTVSGFNQGVENGQASTQTVVQSWAQGVANWFSQKLGISSGNSTEAQNWANSTMTGYNNAVNKNYTKSQSVMEKWADNVRKWFVASGSSKGVNKESWQKFADDVIKAYATEVSSKHVETQGPTEKWASNIRKWFVGENETQGVNEPSWQKFAADIIKGFAEKITGSHSETQSPMEQWAADVKTWFWGDSNLNGTGGMYDAFYNMARRINEGFANGISDFAYMAKEAIRRWAQEAMEEAEDEFDINSPSKEFHTIAEYVVRGFNNGISDMAKTSRSTVQSWLNGVLDVFDGVEVNLPVGVDLPNAASYLPRIATGSIVPPRAGAASASARSAPGIDQEEAFGQLLRKMDDFMSGLQETDGKPMQIVLNLSGNLAALARILKPELDKEASRRGVSLVVVGG